MSWLFSDSVFLTSGLGKFWGVLWLIATVGFVATAFGFDFQTDWIARVVFISAIYSLVAMVPWWRSVSPGVKAGMIFDVIIIVFLIISGRII